MPPFRPAPITVRDLEALRANPDEWHRRGLHTPDEINVIIWRRSRESLDDTDPTYADFLGPES